MAPGPEKVRICLYAVQRGICPGCVIHLPHCLRFELDHILALGDDGEREAEKGVFRMKMPELREHDIM